MPDMNETRRRLTLLVAVLGALCVASAIVLISPIGGSARTGGRRLTELQRELGTKTRETAPLNGIDKKVDNAKLQIDSFYRDRLPGNYSSISEELGKLAAENNVHISTGHYQNDAAEAPAGLTQVYVEAGLAGNYLQVVKFINALERDRMFFLINSVSVGQNQAGAVQLQIRLQTFMRTA
jgi:type IV pilus assembly protein PilO